MSLCSHCEGSVTVHLPQKAPPSPPEYGTCGQTAVRCLQLRDSANTLNLLPLVPLVLGTR